MIGQKKIDVDNKSRVTWKKLEVLGDEIGGNVLDGDGFTELFKTWAHVEQPDP